MSQELEPMADDLFGAESFRLGRKAKKRSAKKMSGSVTGGRVKTAGMTEAIVCTGAVAGAYTRGKMNLVEAGIATLGCSTLI